MTRTSLASLAVSCATLVSLPFTAMAATPQQLIDRLAPQQTMHPEALDGAINITVKERAVVRNTPLTNASIDMHVNQRVLPQASSSTLFDTEGRFSIDKIQATDIPFVLDQPISVQWKYVQGRVFFRVEHLPQSLTDYFKGQGLDLATYIGQWFELDKEVMNNIKEMQTGTTGPLNTSDLRDLTKQRTLMALGIDKRMTDAQGDSIVRVRAKFHPAFFTKLWNDEMKKLDRKSSTYRADYRAALASYQQVAKVLRGMRFVLVINETKNTLTRIELGGMVTEPRKDCTYNARLNREVCRTVAMTDIRYSAGFSILPDAGTAIDVPANPTNFFEFLGSLMGGATSSSGAMMTAPNTQLMINPSSTTPQTATSTYNPMQPTGIY